MLVTVSGLGYLGATHAACLLELGHQVIGLETDATKLHSLNAGKLPFHEPGVSEILREGLGDGRLILKSRVDEDFGEARLHFICVGTPQASPLGDANLDYVFAAVQALLPQLDDESVVVGKSTVPVGTSSKLLEKFGSETGKLRHLAWNPEFLREGSALKDSLEPDRIVSGTNSDHAHDLLRSCYENILETGVPFFSLSFETAELAKVAANAFLATKVSFINGLAEIAELTGADVSDLADVIGLDPRIGRAYLNAGLGFGGGCLPKDLRSLGHMANGLKLVHFSDFLRDVDKINAQQRSRVLEIIEAEIKNVKATRILILGLSFKPGTDDLRDSPALEIATRLLAVGANVSAHDPKVMTSQLQNWTRLDFSDDPLEAARDAEIIVLATDWPEYEALDPVELGRVVAKKVILDCRNAVDRRKWQDEGWRVLSLGRSET